MSSQAEWKQDILDKLIKRDKQTQCDSGIYGSLSYLTAKINDLQFKCDLFSSEKTNYELSKALETIQKLEKNVQLKNDIIKEKESVNHDLMIAFGIVKKDYESVRGGYRKLYDKFSKLQEEVKMNKKIIEIANDNVLELQMENNVLHAKVKNFQSRKS